MSFQVHIGLLGMSEKEAHSFATSVSQAGRIYATYDGREKSLGSPVVAISDSDGDTLANGLLSDAADWNADYWELNPDYVEPLNRVVKQAFVNSLKGIAVTAGWIGDRVTTRLVLTPPELSQLILQNRLPNRTLILLEKPETKAGGADSKTRDVLRTADET